jgi:hypothetical protein
VAVIGKIRISQNMGLVGKWQLNLVIRLVDPIAPLGSASPYSTTDLNTAKWGGGAELAQPPESTTDSMTLHAWHACKCSMQPTYVNPNV